VPAGSLYAPAGQALYLRWVSVWNTTTTATTVALRRLTTTGTQGTALDELGEDPDHTVLGTAFNTHAAGPTITNGAYRRALLGSNGGVIWTFGGTGLRIPAGTGNGIGLLVPDGTGQVWDFDLEWDE
jgi:hypothetical protein